jgi:ferric-dicitrate binding protein FerR (iron transport regulator)
MFLRRSPHSPHVAQQTPPAPRLASTTRGPTDSPMCCAWRRQSQESRDEHEAAFAAAARAWAAYRQPISFVRLAAHRELRQRVHRHHTHTLEPPPRLVVAIQPLVHEFFEPRPPLQPVRRQRHVNGERGPLCHRRQARPTRVLQVIVPTTRSAAPACSAPFKGD